MAALDKALVKAGAKFEREIKGVRHTVEVVKVKGGLVFRDGAGVEYKSFGLAARAASGWASCNPLHFYRVAGATNGKLSGAEGKGLATHRAVRKVKAGRRDAAGVGIADTATMEAVAPAVVALAPSVS